MGIYPGTKTSLDEIAEGDAIAVPNDPTNMTRAFLLLAAAALLVYEFFQPGPTGCTPTCWWPPWPWPWASASRTCPRARN